MSYGGGVVLESWRCSYKHRPQEDQAEPTRPQGTVLLKHSSETPHPRKYHRAKPLYKPHNIDLTKELQQSPERELGRRRNKHTGAPAVWGRCKAVGAAGLRAWQIDATLKEDQPH